MKRKFSDVSDEVASKIQRVCYQYSAPQSNHYTPTDVVNSIMETELRSVIDNFVKVYESLDETIGMESKPNYSYTEMIYIAMLRSANFCLPITEIYKYITTKFPFFSTSGKEHWRNAVRHSLSKTKCFTKIAVGRGVSSSGKLQRSTYLWCIVPSSIINFARGDYRSKVDNESGTNTLRWGYYRMNAGQFWERVSRYVETKMESFKQNLAISSSPATIFESQLCVFGSKTSTFMPHDQKHHGCIYTSTMSPGNHATTTSSPQSTPLHTPQTGSYQRPTSNFTTNSPCSSPVMSTTYRHPAFTDQTSTPVLQRHSSTQNSIVSGQDVYSPRGTDYFMINRMSPISNNAKNVYDSVDSGNGTLSDTSSAESLSSSCRWSDYNVNRVPVVCDGSLSMPVPVLPVRHNVNVSPLSHNINTGHVSSRDVSSTIPKSDDLPCLDSLFKSSNYDNRNGYDFSYWFAASSSCDSTSLPL